METKAELPGQGPGVGSHRSLRLSVPRQGDSLKFQGAIGMGDAHACLLGEEWKNKIFHHLCRTGEGFS